MKTIRAGFAPREDDNTCSPDWKREVICMGIGNGLKCGCEAVLMVERADVQRVFNRTGGGGIFDFCQINVVTCPECGIPTDIGNVPFELKATTALVNVPRVLKLDPETT